MKKIVAIFMVLMLVMMVLSGISSPVYAAIDGAYDWNYSELNKSFNKYQREHESKAGTFIIAALAVIAVIGLASSLRKK